MNLSATDCVQSYVTAVAQIRSGLNSKSGAKKPIIRPGMTILELKGLEWLYQRFDVLNTKDILPGRRQHCYEYAFRAASHDTNLVYCEGQAMSLKCPIPVSHAWCADIDTGEVLDPTWKRAHRGDGYCGIPMRLDFVNKCLLKMQYYGIMENLWMHRDLWTIPLEDIVHPAFHTRVFTTI